MAQELTVTIRAGAEAFPFLLNRKSERLGPVTIEQFWMPLESVYPTGARQGANFRPLVDCWWAGCRQHGADDEQGIREAYLLARLLPRTRSKGSRRIVADALTGGTGRKAVVQLEKMLRQHDARGRDGLSFRNSVVESLGPPAYDDEDRERYEAARSELLDEGCRILLRGDTERAVATAESAWAAWTRKFGRRGGQDRRKQLMDILSYESRAALHQCYSAVWVWLIPTLAERFRLSAEAVLFHRFWHLQHRGPAAETGADDFHVFCGHVFALHPAGGLFIRTEAGRELLGAYLLEPESPTTAGRLLAGLEVAALHYGLSREDEALGRRRQPLRAGSDTLWVEEIEEERARGDLSRDALDYRARPARRRRPR